MNCAQIIRTLYFRGNEQDIDLVTTIHIPHRESNEAEATDNKTLYGFQKEKYCRLNRRESIEQ